MIAGYDGIITRDVRMHLDAAHVLKDLPKFAIVIVQLAQAKKAVYLAAFEEALRRTPLVPQPIILSVCWGIALLAAVSSK